MISLITRIQHRSLYERLLKSLSLAGGEVEVLSEMDGEGQPRIAETYNRLKKQAKGDVLVFCHDDVFFLQPNWDLMLQVELLDKDIVGPVGTSKYVGGSLMRLGKPYCKGRWMSQIDGEEYVKVLSSSGGEVVAVDGMLLAVSKEFAQSHDFDEKLSGLFFYDIDYCLRGRVGLSEVLIAHYKPQELYGKYPADMRPIEDFERYFYAKHGLPGRPKEGDVRCAAVKLDDYLENGQDQIFQDFKPAGAI